MRRFFPRGRVAAIAVTLAVGYAAQVFALEEPRPITLRSEDGAVEMTVQAVVLAEPILVNPDPPLGSRLRVRAAVQVRTTAYDRVTLTLVPYYGGQDLTVIDLYADVSIVPEKLKLRIGRFKEPVSEERVRSFITLPLFERSLVLNLAPARDVGAQVSGVFLDGMLGYALFVGHGTLDRQNGTLNPGGGYELAARVDVRPHESVGVGVGGSWGGRDEPIDHVLYQTSGANPFLRFAEGTRAEGDQWRLGGNAFVVQSRFGARAEVLASSMELELDGASEPATRGVNLAWYGEARAAIFGGELTFSGARPHEGSWAAWLIVARVSQLWVDERWFDSAHVITDASASRATAASLGVLLHATEFNKLLVSYERTWLSGRGGSSGTAEDAVLGRVQFLW